MKEITLTEQIKQQADSIEYCKKTMKIQNETERIWTNIIIDRRTAVLNSLLELQKIKNIRYGQ